MKGVSPGINLGFPGKLILIIITVATTAGGFTLGYFVGRNATPMPPPQTIAEKPAGDVPIPAGETKSLEAVPPAPESPASGGSGQEAARSGRDGISDRQAPSSDPAAGKEAGKIATSRGSADAKSAAARAGSKDGEDKAVSPVATKTGLDRRSQGDGVRYTVQVGAFKNRKDADALTARLEGKGYGAESKKVIVKGKTLFKVMAGEFHEEKEAKVFALKMKKTEGLRAFVTLKK